MYQGQSIPVLQKNHLRYLQNDMSIFMIFECIQFHFTTWVKYVCLLNIIAKEQYSFDAKVILTVIPHHLIPHID